MEKFEVVLSNKEGLHARPASIFTNKASLYKSNITVLKNDNKSVEYNPKSIFSVMSMGAAKGDKLTIIVDGEDEIKAATELKDLIQCEINKGE